MITGALDIPIAEMGMVKKKFVAGITIEELCRITSQGNMDELFQLRQARAYAFEQLESLCEWYGGKVQKNTVANTFVFPKRIGMVFSNICREYTNLLIPVVVKSIPTTMRFMPSISFMATLTNDELNRVSCMRDLIELRETRAYVWGKLEGLCMAFKGNVDKNGAIHTVSFPLIIQKEVEELYKEYEHLLIPVGKI